MEITKSTSDISYLDYPEIFNATYLYEQFGENVKYDGSSWWEWTSQYWKRIDTEERIIQKSRYSLEGLPEKIVEYAPKSEQKKHFIEHCSKSLKMYVISQSVRQLRIDKKVFIDSNQWNKNPYLFNCQNGTVNLRTGELQDHSRDDMINVIAPIDFKENADCPEWKKYLSFATNYDNDFIRFLQQAVGYTLSGFGDIQKFFFLYGRGATGKTVFVETLQRIMGKDYSTTIPSKHLMSNRNGNGDNHKTYTIAELPGKRFVHSDEVSDFSKLDSSLVKKLTGGDSIKARANYAKNSIEFHPVCALWIFGNHKPAIDGSDSGLRRRTIIIPFDNVVPENKRTPLNRFHKILEKEYSGILNWAIQGFIDFESHGLKVPSIVEKTSNEYLDSFDIVKVFLDDCCMEDPFNSISLKELYDSYCKWSFEENRTFTLEKRAFKEQLKDKGFKITIKRRRLTVENLKFYN